MAKSKVDAKIELIRVTIQNEIARLNGLGNDPLNQRGARVNGLEWALKEIKRIEDTVR